MNQGLVLLGAPVHDADGEHVGAVADVRLVQDGTVIGPYGAAYRLSGLIVIKGRHIRLFGSERGVGPAFIRRIVTASPVR